MATNVVMPALGFDMTSGAIARWLKKEGETVNQGEAIAEVDTEKATVEIQAFATGTLQKILVQPGQNVPVGTTIGVIAGAGEPAPTAQPAQAAGAKQPAGPPATVQASPATTPAPQPMRANVVAPAGPPSASTWVKASPVARRMAEAEGVSLADIAGSGPAGRIVEKDIRAFLDQRGKARSGVSAPSAAPKPGEAIGLSRIRQTIARRMAESKSTVPHFYVTFDINMTNAMQLREQLNNLTPENEKPSVNDIVVAAVARTLSKWRVFNASYRGDKLEQHPNINIGIAVARDDGLITAVLHDVDTKSLKELARDSRALIERTRVNKMRSEDLSGSTFTVSNLGMFGVEEFSAIINPPEAAILAVAAVRKTPVVDGNEVRVAQMMKATISVDHRVADGAQAARFMQDFKLLLENPVGLLLTD
jgi:pyruvate dehydrogenase E2 component (dihydrolipoyllysine-residue acetyltransferase)